MNACKLNKCRFHHGNNFKSRYNLTFLAKPCTNCSKLLSTPSKYRYTGQLAITFDQFIRNAKALPIKRSIATHWHFLWTIMVVWDVCMVVVESVVLVLVLAVFVGPVIETCVGNSPRISWPRAADRTVPVGPRRTDSKQIMLSRHVAMISAWKFNKNS